MSDKNDLFGGFSPISSLSDMFVKGDGDGLKTKQTVDDIDDLVDDNDDAKASDKNDVDDVNIDDLKKTKSSTTSKTNKTKQVNHDEDDDSNNDSDDDNDDKDDSDKDEVDDEFVQYEEEVSKYFASDLAEKLNITLPEKYEAKKMDDVISLMIDIIKDNSTPEFANDDVEALNKFVSEGGDIREFYKEIYSDSLNTDKINIENEYDQKAVIKEHLKNKGFKDEKITRAIERYEDAGMLKDEAEDALEALKDFNEKKAKKLLSDQEKFYQDQEKAKHDFIDAVYNNIEKSNSILNVPLSKDEKKEILDYIFKADKNGITQMQKDYQTQESQINDLLERAFIRKFPNKLTLNAKKQGANDALLDVKNKLKAGKDKRSAGGNTSYGKASSQSLTSLSSLFK